VKAEILYVSSSFAFVCGSWFTQNDLITIPTQVVGGEKLKKTEKKQKNKNMNASNCENALNAFPFCLSLVHCNQSVGHGL